MAAAADVVVHVASDYYYEDDANVAAVVAADADVVVHDAVAHEDDANANAL